MFQPCLVDCWLFFFPQDYTKNTQISTKRGWRMGLNPEWILLTFGADSDKDPGMFFSFSHLILNFSGIDAWILMKNIRYIKVAANKNHDLADLNMSCFKLNWA